MSKNLKQSFTANLRALKRDTVARNSRRSKNWLLGKIKTVDKSYIKSRPFPGKIYTFVYSAKHKATLPYYDRNPLILCISYEGNNFLGINFHYLPPKLRAQLLTKIIPYATGSAENATIKANYSQLSRIKMIKPTIKRYLKSYMRSKMVLIPSEEWAEVVMLPYAKFQGASNTSVYKDSRGII